jgi:hypothetical protein
MGVATCGPSRKRTPEDPVAPAIRRNANRVYRGGRDWFGDLVTAQAGFGHGKDHDLSDRVRRYRVFVAITSRR